MTQMSKKDDHLAYCQKQQAAHDTGQRASLTAQMLSRRTILAGGLLTGAFLTGGMLFAGCTPLQQTSAPEGTPERHLLFSTAWQGIDFAWLPDSIQLACASDRGLFIVDTKNGKQVWKQQSWPQHDYKYTKMVKWSSDGTRLAYLTDVAILVQDVRSGQNMWSYQGHSLATLTAEISPEGTRLACVQSPSTETSADEAVQIWNVQEGRLMTQYVNQQNNKKVANVSSLKWSPDGAYLASTGQDGSVQVRQASDGHLLWAYDEQAVLGPREAIGWSPDGSSLAFIAGGERGQTLLGVWNARTGQVRFQAIASVGYPLKDDRSEKYIAWSPDGAQIAFEVQDHDQPVIEVWSVQTGKHSFTCQPISKRPTNITWSPDGKYIAAGNAVVGSGEMIDGDNGDRSVIQFWDASNGQALFTYSAPKRPGHLSWSPDSSSLAIITPTGYGVLPNKTCLSMCRYGYINDALEIFQIK